MSDLLIKSNFQWRQFKYRYEVPAEVLADRFEHLTEDDCDGYFCYRGWWYHTSDFMRFDDRSPFPNTWHGYHSDSFFSGVLIELSDDGEAYRVGTYTS